MCINNGCMNLYALTARSTIPTCGLPVNRNDTRVGKIGSANYFYRTIHDVPGHSYDRHEQVGHCTDERHSYQASALQQAPLIFN